MRNMAIRIPSVRTVKQLSNENLLVYHDNMLSYVTKKHSSVLQGATPQADKEMGHQENAEHQFMGNEHANECRCRSNSVLDDKVSDVASIGSINSDEINDLLSHSDNDLGDLDGKDNEVILANRQCNVRIDAILAQESFK